MLPTRKQFKDFIAAIRHAQEKEDKLDKAFELIWDDDQAQHVPFYISPLWDAIYLAFNIMFDCEDIEVVGNELAWWFEMADFDATMPGVWTVIHTTARLWTTPCHAGKPA